MRWLLCRQGVYWPAMLKGYIKFSNGCQECQIHARIQHVSASELHAVVKPWPFGVWDLDLIGKIRPASSKSPKYILVRIDYFRLCNAPTTSVCMQFFYNLIEEIRDILRMNYLVVFILYHIVMETVYQIIYLVNLLCLVPAYKMYVITLHACH